MEPDTQNHVYGSANGGTGESFPCQGLGQRPRVLTLFWQYGGVLFFTSYLHERGCGKMSEKERAYWQRFLQTGQVEDYLRYCKYTTEQAENPRRRIEEASRHKKFY